MEIIKFNAFDTEGKLVYCSYRKFEKGEKGTQIERSLPFDKFIESIKSKETWGTAWYQLTWFIFFVEYILSQWLLVEFVIYN